MRLVGLIAVILMILVCAVFVVGRRLRITEDGEIYNPLFRFVSRYVIGETQTIDPHLVDVGRAARR